MLLIIVDSLELVRKLFLSRGQPPFPPGIVFEKSLFAKLPVGVKKFFLTPRKPKTDKIQM